MTNEGPPSQRQRTVTRFAPSRAETSVTPAHSKDVSHAPPSVR